MLAEEPLCLVIRLLQDLDDLLVNLGRSGIRTVHDDSSVIQELGCRRFQLGKPELFRHTILRHHRSCNSCRLLNVVRGARGHGIEYNLLGCAACDKFDKHRADLLLRVEVLLLLRHIHDIAERTHGPWDNGDLLHRLRILLERGDKRVADLMVGHDLPLLLREDAALLLLADQDNFDSLQEIFLTHGSPMVLNCEDCRLIDHICQIRSDRAGGRKRDLLQVDRLIHMYIL